MFKSFVLGLYASGHSLHVRVTQTFAVINVCLFSHILCGRLSIFYAGCDPALFFSVPAFRCPVSGPSVAGFSAPWCPVPVSFASGRIVVSDEAERYRSCDPFAERDAKVLL